MRFPPDPRHVARGRRHPGQAGRRALGCGHGPHRRPSPRRALDVADPVGHARDRFVLPEGVVYLDGNSLGALPAAVPDVGARRRRAAVGPRPDHVVERERLVGRAAPGRCPVIARLVGAGDDEVLVADSTSVNLFKVLVAAARLRPDRRASCGRAGQLPGRPLHRRPVGDLLGLRGPPGRARRGRPRARRRRRGRRFRQVDYRTGRAYDMAGRSPGAVHDAGALMVWDLSHSAGALPVDLRAARARTSRSAAATSTSTAGPGAPAYVMRGRAPPRAMRTPLPGWTGHARPFAMEGSYAPGPGHRRVSAAAPRRCCRCWRWRPRWPPSTGVDHGRRTGQEPVADTRCSSSSPTSVLAPLGFAVGHAAGRRRSAAARCRCATTRRTASCRR